MQCEKCGSSSLQPVKIFRLSGCLVAAGVALIVTSLAALAVGLVLAAVGPSATREAVSTRDARAKSEAIYALEKIPGLAGTVVQEFESERKIPEETLAQLPPEKRTRVRRVLIDYHAARVGTGIGGAVTAGVGTFFVVVLFAFGIPGIIVGLLLVRRTKVWRCATCGFAFDRT